MATPPPTRGTGLLERFLAERRARHADRHLPDRLRSGTIVDVGCGTHPRFLSATAFRTKHGLERQAAEMTIDGIPVSPFDIMADDRLPFPDHSIQAVTALAVIEHVSTERSLNLFREAYRILVPDGVIFVTTPAGWTRPLLSAMGFLNLVSKEEIEEHKQFFSPATLADQLSASGYAPDRITTGHYLFGSVIWAIAEK